MAGLMMTRRLRTWSIAAVVLALALAGCTSEDEAPSESSTPSEVSVTTSTPSSSSTFVQLDPIALPAGLDAPGSGSLLAFDDGFLLSMSLGPDGPSYWMTQLDTTGGQARLSEDVRDFHGTYAGVPRSMDAGRLVWPMTEDRTSPDAPDSALDIYLYDWESAETRRLTQNEEADTDPAIAGNWVAWTAGSGSQDGSRVLIHDLSADTTEELSASGLEAYGVSLHEDQAAWVQQGDEGGWEIWYRELPEGEPRRVEGDYPGTPPVQPPSVGPAGVMWVSAEEEGERAGRIWFAPRSSEGLEPAGPLDLSTPVEWAALHGELILWQGSAPEDPSQYPSLMLYDLEREQGLELGAGTMVGANLDLGSEEGLVAWAALTEAAWLVQAYDVATGEAQTLQQLPLPEVPPGAVPQPVVDGNRVAWRAPLPDEAGGALGLWVVEREG